MVRIETTTAGQQQQQRIKIALHSNIQKVMEISYARTWVIRKEIRLQTMSAKCLHWRIELELTNTYFESIENRSDFVIWFTKWHRIYDASVLCRNNVPNLPHPLAISFVISVRFYGCDQIWSSFFGTTTLYTIGLN